MSDTFLPKQHIDLPALAHANKEAYRQARPFPSISFENFFNPDFLDEVLNEFPDLSQKKSVSFNNRKEIKLAGRGEAFFGEKTKQFMHFLNSERFLSFLQVLTGIKETLIGDPYFVGGGQHEIKRGGLLKIHADFNKHPALGLDRRLNVLVYLNKHWKESYGGHFELWDDNMEKCVKKVLPGFNTLAIFSTTDFSYHGHPDPLNCPENMSRKSLALYYYSNGRPAKEIQKGLENHSTLFQARRNSNTDNRIAMKMSLLKQDVERIAKLTLPPFLFKGLKKMFGSERQNYS